MMGTHDKGRSVGARWLQTAVVLLSGWGLAGAAACAGGEDVPLFGNTGGKSGGSGGHAGSSSTSGSVDNGGASGTGQGGSGQGGSAQGGSAQGGSAQGGSAQGGSAQGGSAGTATAGAGGSAGSPNTDAGTPDAAMTSCNQLALFGTPVTGQGVTLQYMNASQDTADAIIAFDLELTASTTLALNQLEIRYFFTNEVTTPTTLELYYAGAGNSGRDIGAKIHKTLVSAALGAGIDSYLSYTIDDTGTVAAGEKIKINPAFHTTDYQQKLNECNDYSYDGSASSFKDNPRIAVYLNGTLIWGAVPGGPTPEAGADGAPIDASVEDAASDASPDAPADQTSAERAADAAVE